ncbi:MAG TPA: hypothetical protein G4O00_10230 [Thermoflexia bacterium]|nr:hypothetical protein [Thermoflexia bacterium]
MRRKEGQRHGQALVEFAIVLPILLLVLLGIVEFARAFFIYTNLFNAAREGVRYGIVQPRDLTGVYQHVQEKITLVPTDDVTLQVWYDKGPGTSIFTDTTSLVVGDRIVVDLQYDLYFVTPLFQPIGGPMNLHTRAARTIQSLGDTITPPPGEGEGQEQAAILLDVTASQSMIYGGDTVQFTYTIQNTGEIALTNVVLVDSFGNTYDIGTVPAGETVVRTLAVSLDASTTNVVTVDGTRPDGGTVSATDEVTVVVIHPNIDLTVSVDPAYISTPGTVVEFTYVVQNTGDITLTQVTVVDSFGSSFGPLTLSPGGTPVAWTVSQEIGETTTNEVTASGLDPLGGTVSDSESATVVLSVEFDPIYIQRPLEAGDTAVSGTAEPGNDVCIRDLMSSSFPQFCTTVSPQGTFTFSNLPPLEPGHVIEVYGYGYSDAAVVTGELADLVLNEPLCHGSTLVTGSGQPGRSITLIITDTTGYFYQSGGYIDASGLFTIALSTDQPLQTDQTVRVSGYGDSDTAIVQGCTTDAYIAIAPQCGGPGPVTIRVRGYNWVYQNKNDHVQIRWDGDVKVAVDASDRPSEWEITFVADATEGTHIVSAMNRKVPEVAVTFVSPCPMPDLTVTELELITTTDVISTYQPLNFRVTVANIGDRAANNLFWVDLYTADPITRAIAWAAVGSLDAGSTIPLTITMYSGFEVTGTYSIWTEVDSLDAVAETSEDNNMMGPITVTVSAEGTPPEPPPSGTGSIIGETWISLAGTLSPYPRVTIRVMGCGVDTYTFSDENAAYSVDSLPPCTYTVIGETWINGNRYSNTYQVTVGDNETIPLIIILYEN